MPAAGSAGTGGTLGTAAQPCCHGNATGALQHEERRQTPSSTGGVVFLYVSSNVLKLLLDVKLVEWDQFWQRA